MEAERDIENPQSPLFLRFVNHLINDAIFLLDEALSVCKIPVIETAVCLYIITYELKTNF